MEAYEKTASKIDKAGRFKNNARVTCPINMWPLTSFLCGIPSFAILIFQIRLFFMAISPEPDTASPTNSPPGLRPDDVVGRQVLRLELPEDLIRGARSSRHGLPHKRGLLSLKTAPGCRSRISGAGPMARKTMASRMMA